MKTLTVGNVTLEIKDFSKNRDKVVGVYAKIEIPETSISYTDLNALFTDNAEDLILTDVDGSVTTYSGYSKLDEVRMKDGVFTIHQICESEALHLLNEARKQIETLERENALLQSEVNLQTEEILAQAEVIVAQGETIAVQNEQVAALMEASTSQLDAIDSIMTEVLPLVAQEAANMAVEQALAAIADDEEPEDDAEYYNNLEQEAYEEMIASETTTEEE